MLKTELAHCEELCDRMEDPTIQLLDVSIMVTHHSLRQTYSNDFLMTIEEKKKHLLRGDEGDMQLVAGVVADMYRGIQQIFGEQRAAVTLRLLHDRDAAIRENTHLKRKLETAEEWGAKKRKQDMSV